MDRRQCVGDSHEERDQNIAGSKDESQRLFTRRNRLLVRVVTLVWNERADNNLRPMILLEEESLAAWMMGGIVLLLHQGFMCAPTRGPHVL